MMASDNYWKEPTPHIEQMIACSHCGTTYCNVCHCRCPKCQVIPHEKQMVACSNCDMTYCKICHNKCPKCQSVHIVNTDAAYKKWKEQHSFTSVPFVIIDTKAEDEKLNQVFEQLLSKWNKRRGKKK